MHVGYARTSATGPSALKQQVAALEQAGCDKIVTETISLTTPKRPKLAKAMRALGPGDTLVVAEPHRLTASLAEIVAIATTLAERGAGLKIVSLGFDSSERGSKRTLKLLASLAESERAVRHERQAEGIARAHAAGKRFGRPPMVDEIPTVLALRAEGRSLSDIVKETGISRATIYRWLAAHPHGASDGQGAPVA